MSKSILVGVMLIVAAALLSGCAKSNDPAADTSRAKPTIDSQYLLDQKPTKAQGVAQVREEVQDATAVAVEGRIGGSPAPFVDGLAAFTIVDPQLAWCADGEGCPTPWDYCCSDLEGQVAMVKVVGQDGQPVAKDARELLGVKELAHVIVRGTAQRDEQGNLTVLADKIHVITN